jgi:hypothetical protein
MLVRIELSWFDALRKHEPYGSLESDAREMATDRRDNVFFVSIENKGLRTLQESRELVAET